MRKLLALPLVATLGGCVLVADDDYDHDHHYVPAPPSQPLPAAHHLDCGWLAAWNCWDVAVAEAEACAPQTYGDAFGGLYGDNGYACYYPDGGAVFFEQPVTVPLRPDHLWSFTMEDPRGQTCGWFVETETSLSLGTASGVVDVVFDWSGISVTCQDGTQWYNPDPYALTGCIDSEWEQPGYWRESAAGASSFGLLGGYQPVLWSCGW